MDFPFTPSDNSPLSNCMHARDSYLRTRLGIQADSASTTNMATSSDNAEPVVDISSKKITTSRHYCVPLCTSDSRYQPKLNFHHIPKDEALKKQWIHSIRRDEGPMFKISKATVVCSKHFKAEDYGGWNPVRKRLKPGAVPSIFNWTNIKEPRRALKRKLVAPATKPDTEKENDETMEIGDGLAEQEEDTTSSPPTDEKDTRIREQEKRLPQTEEECSALKNKLQMERFGINRFSFDDAQMCFYTGFPSYRLFLAFFECIEPSASNMRSAYYQSSDTVSLTGRKRCMLLIDELFMFLCRLGVGLLENDLSVRFNCSLATVSRKIVTWSNFLYFVLGSIPIWLSKDDVQMLMPDCFKSLYPRTRVIIDCTEIKTQQPSSLVLNSQLYSSYKGTNTLKCLIGIAPHGAITFVSSLYTGCMSDVEITKLSGLLDLLEPGDDVMADKGFTLRKVLAEKQVTLNIPHFLSSKKQFTVNEIVETEQVAKLRIHVERVNRRIKENHLFDCPLPMSLAGSANQLWAVACLLANFKGPIVNAWNQNA